MELTAEIAKLTDAALVGNLLSLRQRENEVLSDLLLHVSELDKRESYRDIGFSSLFTYMREGLQYSEGGAQRRILAARVLGQNPDLYGKIRSGAVSLSALAEIAKVRDLGTQHHLLQRAEGQSRREVEKLVAAYLPPGRPKGERVRVRGVAAAAVAAAPSAGAPLFESPAVRTNIRHDSPPPAAAEVVYSVTLELDSETMGLLAEAKALLPGKSSDVIRQALEDLLDKRSPKRREERREKRKVAAAAKKAASAGKAAKAPEGKAIQVRRHVPVPVRDRIIVRDEGRCTFVRPDRKRCGETRCLEVDHVYPFSLGGGHEEGNLRVLCRAHNQLMAERVFGKGKMMAARKRV